MEFVSVTELFHSLESRKQITSKCFNGIKFTIMFLGFHGLYTETEQWYTFRRHKIKLSSHFWVDLFLFCQCKNILLLRFFNYTFRFTTSLFQTADIFMPIEKWFEWSPSQVIWEQAGCAQVTDFLQLNSREFLADRPPAEQTSSAVTWTHHAHPPTKLELPMIFMASS